MQGRPATAGRPKGDLAGLKSLIAPVEVQVCALPASAPAVERSLQELDLRSRTGVTVLALVREGRLAASPAPGLRLAAGDLLVLAGSAEQVGQAIEALVGSATGE
jgi:K+/H+ antiporter YhaU regulatory subunit KhtT